MKSTTSGREKALARKLTIQAGNYGLTTAVDDEVILALIQLTRTHNNFKTRRLEFTRHELIKMLDWPRTGTSYDRILLALRKWTSVYLDYENAWRDNRAKAWITKGFHIIDLFEFNDSRSSGDQLDLLPSYIVWNEVIFESFQAGYLKTLDYDLCMGLSNSTAKRMYRFLDKRFWQKPDLEFELKAFAHEHVGLGRNYDGPAHLKRKLQPAITELENVGFLEPLSETQRFPKDGKNWKIRLIQKSPTPTIAKALPQAIEPETPPLVAELTKRGITTKSAAELVQQHTAEAIQAKIDVFDWLVEKQDKRVARSPAGYLVKSIDDDYARPKGFTSKAERQRRQEAGQAAERQAAEDRRRKRAEESAERARDARIAAYRKSLTPEQLARLEADAIARAGEDMRRSLDDPAMKPFRKTLVLGLVGDHIAQLIQAGELVIGPA